MVPSFSEQQLIDCSLASNTNSKGGSRLSSFNYTKTFGMTTSDKYPYMNKKGKCLYEEELDRVFHIDHYKAFDYMNNRDLERLVCQGAIPVGMRINGCFRHYEKGVVYDNDLSCGCSEMPSTNHAVVIVGFGRDESDAKCKDYWLVKNSWGPRWGEDGFMRVCKEDNQLA